MKYLLPEFLWLALALPLQLAAYIWLLRHKRKRAMRFSHTALVRQAMGSHVTWRRHVPPMLLMAASTLMLMSLARPASLLILPMERQTVILAVDVSGSMLASDVAPTRLKACQQAARDFVTGLPRQVRLGLVAYADSAQLVQTPTTQRRAIIDAIDRLQLQGGTAMGDGIATALSALFPDRDVEPNGEFRTGSALPLGSQRSSARRSLAAMPPVPPGSDRSAVIVLLTDGQNTQGMDPLKAASIAADRGIRVYTVGYGTREGEVTGPDGYAVNVRLDEETLRQIAQMTGAEYFHAADGLQLASIYQGLKGRLVIEAKDTEVSALFAAGSALLLLVGLGLSLWWFGREP
jgi:Ca-activated chloride channel family protein